jgi:hypothetical protein
MILPESVKQVRFELERESKRGKAPLLHIFPLSFEGEGFTLKGSP